MSPVTFLPIIDPEPAEAELQEYLQDIKFSRHASSEKRLSLAKLVWKSAMSEKDPDAFLVPFVKDNESYNEYLASPEWASIRLEVLRLHDHECACCGEKATQVHHRDYRPRVLRGEDMNALVLVCKRCHELVDKVKRTDWNAANSYGHKGSYLGAL